MGVHGFLKESPKGILEKVPLQKAANKTINQGECKKAGGSCEKSGKEADSTPE